MSARPDGGRAGEKRREPQMEGGWLCYSEDEAMGPIIPIPDSTDTAQLSALAALSAPSLETDRVCSSCGVYLGASAEGDGERCVNCALTVCRPTPEMAGAVDWVSCMACGEARCLNNDPLARCDRHPLGGTAATPEVRDG